MSRAPSALSEHIRVSAVKTAHSPSVASFGFLVECEGKRIYFSGDMCHDLHDFPALLYETEVDLLITELAHFPVDLLFEKLRDCRAKRICLNHVYPVTKIDEALARKSELRADLFAASDGDTVIL